MLLYCQPGPALFAGPTTVGAVPTGTVFPPIVPTGNGNVCVGKVYEEPGLVK